MIENRIIFANFNQLSHPEFVDTQLYIFRCIPDEWWLSIFYSAGSILSKIKNNIAAEIKELRIFKSIKKLLGYSFATTSSGFWPID